METLALIHAYIEYEDPRPSPQLRSFEELGITIPSSAWLGVVSIALALSVVTAIPESAQAALRRGSAGIAVEDVQLALIKAGFNVGRVDGVYGPTTEAAVIQFQKRYGLSVDGVVGSRTAAALGVTDSDPSFSGGGGGGNIPNDYVTIATNGSYLNVRSGPGLGYSVVNSLGNGTIVGTTGAVSNGWVQLSQGGWVSSRWVTGVGGGGGGGVSGDAVIVSTNGSYLNVRSGPGLGYGVIKSLPNGTTVASTGTTSNGWIRLSQGGWVSSRWVRVR
jgi:peptidoglycan hydrolase-like protein with peptidoglycan-binding domain